MGPVRYYFSIFLRRFPYFLIVALIVSVASIIIARALPPTYESQMRLIVESPQIPGNLAASTVNTSAAEQLQIVEQRLLTRPVLLDIARNFEVLSDQQEATPDQIVDTLRRNTHIHISTGRNQASLMTIVFEARSGAIAAGVLNEYLTEIQKLDVSYRKGRASDTLEFFEQEVERLSDELDKRSARILKFQNENSDALPSSLQFRMAQQGTLQTNLEQTDQQIFALKGQREKLLSIYSSTGQIVGVGQQAQTQAQQQLAQLRNQLDNQLVLYSESNPQIKLLRAHIERLEDVVAAEQAAGSVPADTQTGNSALDIQLAQLDSQIAAEEDKRAVIEERLTDLTLTIDQTPANAITLAELQRDHDNIQTQYNNAVTRLASASTGERIEVTSQGQRISVIEYPVVPSGPTKPNRLMIAGGGTVFGIGLGLGLIVLLELLNRSVRRPEDLINKLEVWPIATIPYMRSRKEVIVYRLAWIAVILAIMVGVPAAVWAVHTYYLPLDLIAERVMDKLEVRW
ncbi:MULTISPECIES: lipopolysaccharide biosynthesis [unclassified Ruegeria]|uniref:GumC family protein n=1 Tax=unclassified Ruegeria TaxID=2625375 RepID=UPI001493122C|nr:MULTISPECIES: lipopolysaccharide biosynthesis [unclassified Ruegeria]NOD78605.1 lipopolysaccharide biosynthesis [Ruegeria sp. HKCCD4332]NOD90918.1 lipopolysaccharide biosynthesis [Ruegeria sp. HKCCD4318]NOE16306.1 lipopolysaccharide biosynthesis [Ruegeria sp. HKCCD4318-2]NOG11768.1 lipopolysaccharide biosynthesis [Ruegeria sp. HKCCD4315]